MTGRHLLLGPHPQRSARLDDALEGEPMVGRRHQFQGGQHAVGQRTPGAIGVDRVGAILPCRCQLAGCPLQEADQGAGVVLLDQSAQRADVVG
ncbi:hypothetical protein SDC9_187450 [bioreactor metagenome]|uniref:Uncharacterized protein n=1 Tax=bioreactor metagenome TaxID=1076179 RepID=A0A645HMX3_9ZZZZ